MSNEAAESNVEITPDDSSVETSEASASEVSLESVYSLDDSQLDEYLASGKLPESSSEESIGESTEEGEDEVLEVSTGLEDQAITEEEEFEEFASEEEELDDSDTLEEEKDYKDIYQQIFETPFKANGRDMMVESPEEVIRLMQQGANYHQNMEKFAPFKKAMKVLEKRDALDPAKLDFLLDVAEGKPEAISKLLKDHNVDPYDINVDLGDQYVSEYKDTEAVDTINETFDALPPGDNKVRTLELLSKNGWDSKSRAEIFSHPESIPELHRQISDGTYDKIMTALEKKRAFGELIGISDLQAYNMVGTELESQGKLGVPNAPTESSNSPDPKKKANLNQKRKKAAGAPRQVPSNVPNTEDEFNPATASPEEVDRFIQNHLRTAR